MFKARYLFSALAGMLGVAAMAPEASAKLVARCDSSIWINTQNCTFHNGTANFQSLAQTTSDPTNTAHAITLSMSKPGGGFSATATALDGSGRVIAGASVTSSGGAVPVSFRTSASAPPRRLQVTLQNGGVPVPINVDVTTFDYWEANLNARYFDFNEALAAQCDASRSSDSTLTSHRISANLRKGAVCVTRAFDKNLKLIALISDGATGQTPVQLNFTTTFDGRPRRIETAVSP